GARVDGRLRQITQVDGGLNASERVELVVAHVDRRGVDVSHDGERASTVTALPTARPPGVAPAGSGGARGPVPLTREPGARFPPPGRSARAGPGTGGRDDQPCARALEWLPPPTPPPPEAAPPRLASAHLIDAGDAALLAVHRPHADAIRAHAERALTAAA